MKRKKPLAFICALTVGFASLFIGCSNGDSSSLQPEDIVYPLYLSYAETAEAAGNTPLSYEEWLLSLKGDRGEKGDDGQDGAKGETGDRGDDGKSAYEIWLEAGYTGSKADFIEFIKGEKGDDGQDGAKGETGDKGDDGKSAYEIWLEAGYTGSEADFIEFIKGEKGDDGQDGAKGETGDKGNDGKSAYEIWLEAGYTGSEADFIEFIKGEKGDDGISITGAYINSDTHLILQMSDGNQIDAGYVGVSVGDGEMEFYTVTFVADGVTVGTVRYRSGDNSVIAPQVPAKEGYTGRWEEYTLTSENITVNAIYTETEEEEPPVLPDDTESTYLINVQSAGGLKLDGVKLSATDASGNVLMSAVSSEGKVEFWLPLGEYTVQIDASTLPKGYYTDGSVYKTSASAHTEITVKIPSAVIEESATDELAYNIGNIAKDFTLTDYLGQQYRLSEILEEKKAVIINFWDPQSVESKERLSVLQNVYSDNEEVEILGVCRSSYTNNKIKAFVEDNAQLGITLPLLSDKANLFENYGISSVPSMIIIDRYGMIAYSDTSALSDFNSLSALVKRFTSNSYIQSVS